MTVTPEAEVHTGLPGPESHWRELTHDRRVPRRSVHKASEAEVLLTDAMHLGGERYAVAAAWHRDHYLAHRGGPAADPVLLVETVRQTAIHLSHRFLGVPHGMPFVLSEARVELVEDLPAPDAVPLGVGLDVTCRRAATSARRLRLELEGDVLVRHRRLGRVRLCWEPMEPRRYAVVRRHGGQGAPAGPSEPGPARVALEPVRVGHLSRRDVLIDADPLRADRWWLRLDTEHPVLFDHESDHVPGMALVEAFRQAGRVATAGSRPQAGGVRLLDVAFTAFGELDAPVTITAHPLGDGLSAFRAHQGGRELACARIGGAATTPGTARAGTATGTAC
ncbi:ScbA/BarX family gamma-butyrolactone biosynthesis protein [Streptomyces sp. WAC 04229]|uniref:ScbA/BarX family gamma-butyrolactone biosynthesis protein n=1 Tax=Streptomyces sp. WAC 04229 TaxID=2203206 RepID=UPI00163CDAB0|nr:ScbA/BarX family gamma-butyrolactone biosynthesis protein [Streptomyces sp. WAC 04229]